MSDACIFSFSERQEEGTGKKAETGAWHPVQGYGPFRGSQSEGGIFHRKCLPGVLPGYGDALRGKRADLCGNTVYHGGTGEQCGAGKAAVQSGDAEP